MEPMGAEVVQATTTADILGIEAETTTDWTYADSSAQGALRLSGLPFSAPPERKNMEGINPAAEIIFLNSTQDGKEKITKDLKGPKNIDAELTIISDARSDTHIIFTDGGHDGEPAVGRVVAEKFAQFTCADIAASTDLPGSANFGVQWDLELNGVFPYIIDSAGSQEWHGLLTETTFITYEPASLEIGEQANEIHSTKPWGQTFLYDSTRSIYTVDRNGLVLTSTFPSGFS